MFVFSPFLSDILGLGFPRVSMGVGGWPLRYQERRG